MNKFLLFFLVCCNFLSTLAQSPTPKDLQGLSSNTKFVENKGQIIDQEGKPNLKVRYLLNTAGLNVQLRNTGFSYDVYEKKENKARIKEAPYLPLNQRINQEKSTTSKYDFHRVDINFLNTNPGLSIQGNGKGSAYTSFYNTPGKDKSVLKVFSYKSVTYKNLYQGIDLVFYVPKDPSKPVEYNFIIHPEGRITDIEMQILGAKAQLISGELEMQLKFGKMKEIIPASWFQQDDQKRQVKINFTQKSKNTFGFALAEGKRQQDGASLIIDPSPVREWASYFGGAEDESYFTGSVKTDSKGNAVITGYSESINNIATSGRPETLYELERLGFIAKFDPEGKLLWSSYYGGRKGAIFRNLDIDSEDNIIAVGESDSQNNIATPGSHQPEWYEPESSSFSDGFIVKFRPDGERIWGTYFGGESMDYLLDIAINKDDDFYVVGSTASHENISTPGSFMEQGTAYVHEQWNGIIAKFDKNGSRIWASFYPGEDITALDIDSKGNIYFAGSTSLQEGLTTPGAYQEIFSYDEMLWTEVFLGKFSPNGERLWGTYYGGFDYEFVDDLTIDSKDNVIISGSTRSEKRIATAGAQQENKSGDYSDWDTFLAKFSPKGERTWSTFYGGKDLENWGNIMVQTDGEDNIFLFGNTNSSSGIATPDGFQPEKAGDADLFLVKFKETGERTWGTYYGGNTSDFSLDIDITSKGEIYLIGWTISSSGIATPGAHQEEYGGKYDAFLVKFKDCLSSITTDVPEGLCTGEDLQLKATGGASYLWTGPNGFSSSLPNPTIPNVGPENSGSYALEINAGQDCKDTRTFDILISELPNIQQLPDIEVCETNVGTGISSAINLKEVKDQVLAEHPDLVINFYDETGTEISESSLANYSNSIPHQENITAQIAASENSACFVTHNFNIIIYDLPTGNNIADLYACDDDQDGFASFDITNLKKDINGDQSNLEVLFFDTEGLALDFSGTNFTNTEKNTQQVVAKIINENECEESIIFNLIVSSTPIAYPPTELIGCDDNDDGISEYFKTSAVEAQVLNGQTGLEVNYFDSAGNKLEQGLAATYTNIIPYQDKIIIRLSEPGSPCYSETSLNLRTSEAPILKTPKNFYACDLGGGIGYFDTSSWKENIVGDQVGLNLSFYTENGEKLIQDLPENFANTIPYSQQIFVKVENEENAACVSETNFQLVVNPELQIDLEDSYTICDLQPFIDLELTDNFDSWTWKFEDGSLISSNSNVKLTQAGQYSVEVVKLQNGIACKEYHSFELLRSELPEITQVNFQEWSSSNYIEIIASGDGDFEYSIDGENYQDSNYFEKIPGGTYTTYVRDKKGCGEASKQIVLVDYPKFFTPNADGYNDYWQLKGLSKAPETIIFIYDRYGKLLKQFKAGGKGWDGTYNSKPMPVNDYWFSTIIDQKEFKGHFTLKR